MTKRLFVLCFALLLFFYPKAQVTAAEKTELIDSVIKTLNDRYVFPEVAKKMENSIRLLQQQKAYDTFSSGDLFARKITEDLRAICKDRHVTVNYSAAEIPYEPDRDLMGIPENEKEGYGNMLRHVNYGIHAVDILKGNIGYLDVELFCSPEFAGDTYAAVMNYLAHTDALIIDLRNCTGSVSPDAIPFICSYFFHSPVHLNDFYWRKDNRYVQSWTYSYVPGKKYLDKPIYVLTSAKTFSGAEELAYDLKNLRRAVIIGQPTGGGANPGGDIRLTAHFNMFIPVGRAINPVTKTNWEGSGVRPDTIINSRLALYKAQRLALQYLINDAKDAQWKNALQFRLNDLTNNEPVLKPVLFELKNYASAKEVYVTGSFNDWSPRETKLEHKGNAWTATVDAEPGKISYKFIVDGTYITDPANKQKEADGQYTNSIRFVK